MHSCQIMKFSSSQILSTIQWRKCNFCSVIYTCLYTLHFESIWNADIHSFITRGIKFECVIKLEMHFKWVSEQNWGSRQEATVTNVIGYFVRWPLRWKPGRQRIDFRLMGMGDGAKHSWKRLRYTVIRARHTATHKASLKNSSSL